MFCLYKPCAMCLSWLHFQPCAGGEPDCNCCLSNKYTYMQLRSPEVTRVNFHLSHREPHKHQSSQVSHTYSFIHSSHTHTHKHTCTLAHRHRHKQTDRHTHTHTHTHTLL